MKFPKSKRLKLLPEDYKEQSRKLFDAYGWRCSVCGRIVPLQRHHIQPRSHGGGDEEQNFAPLCMDCHRDIHERKRKDIHNDKGR